MLPNSHTTWQQVTPCRITFEIVTGQQPLTLSSLAIVYKGPSLPSYKFSKDWNDYVYLAQAYLEKAKKIEKWADKNKCSREFQVGNLVLVKMYNHERLSGYRRGLIKRYGDAYP